MFEKILASLPFNPSLVNQLSFYHKRMSAEKSIRRIGLIFISFAFLIQFFAVISPPVETSAASPNDLVNGGFQNASQAAADCNSNLQGYRDILDNYGITCSMVASAQTISINSRQWNGQLYSMGRQPGSDYGKSLPGETPININGTILYARYLWGWDSPGTSSTYQALNVTTPGGQTFLLLYNCGNITSVGFPQPIPKPTPPTPPKPIVNCPYDSSIPQTDSACVVCPYNNQIIATNSQCKPCEQSLSSSDTLACIVPSKSATNLTQGVQDANGTTAQAGDLIEYTLYAKNVGKATQKAYVFSDNLTYVLNYSQIVQTNGGTVDSNNVISWPATDIAAGQTATEKFQVKVDNPIPGTPASSSDPTYFNLTMHNTYGNTITIKLPQTPAKVVETVTTTNLPNTGPGTSLFIAALVVSVAGFFFYRSRVLVKESAIAINETIEGEM